jgi:serine/threonine-protein kinase
MPEVGDTLGDRYVLLDRIAQGGMGEIWRANDTLLERAVAVKVLLPALAGDSGSAGRFLAEARTMATVSHPAIVEVYDYGRSGALAYLVMQFVNGESLREVLAREERLAADRTMEIVAQAATALHMAHGRGIVHRDVKPGNLLIRPDGQVVLTDFGIATLVNRARLTAADSVLGTPSYLAPEQLAGEEATAATDVYALGVVAYECLAGRCPFVAGTPYEVALMHSEFPPPPLPDQVAPEVRGVVMRALAKNPADRWPSALDMAAAAALAVAPVPGTDLVPVVRPVPAVIDRRPRGRRPAVLAAGVFAVVAAAATLIAVQGSSTGVDVLSGPSTMVSSRSASPRGSVDPTRARQPGGTLPGGAMAPLGEASVGDATGSTQSAPDVPPSNGQSGKPSTTAKPTAPVGFVLVPDVAGLTEAAAIDQLMAAGLRPEVQYAVPAGPCVVVAQDPPAGQAVHRNSKVTLTVGRPPSACPS